MSKILKYTDFVNEGKQVGILYHYTSLQNFLKIIQVNHLKSSQDDGISDYYVSFTRNKNLHKVLNNSGLNGLTISLMLDGDKLSDKYKIYPIDYFNTRTNKKRGTIIYPDEYEERIEWEKETEITPLSKYLKSIRIIKDIFDKECDTFISKQKYWQDNMILNINKHEYLLNVETVDSFKRDFFNMLDKINLKYEIIK